MEIPLTIIIVLQVLQLLQSDYNGKVKTEILKELKQLNHGFKFGYYNSVTSSDEET